MKVLVHDGIGIWLAARRLHQGHFEEQLDSLNAEQLRTLARALIDQAASREKLLASKDCEIKYR